MQLPQYDVNAPAQSPIEPLPAGWYAMQIVKAEVAKSKAGYDMLKLDLEVMESAHPEYGSRHAWTNLNLWFGLDGPPPSDEAKAQKTRDIANRDFSAIRQAIGRQNVGDTDQLLGGQLLVLLEVRPPEGQYSARNEVKGYKPLEGAQQVAPAPQAAAPSNSQPAPAPKSTVAPWKK